MASSAKCSKLEPAVTTRSILSQRTSVPERSEVRGSRKRSEPGAGPSNMRHPPSGSEAMASRSQRRQTSGPPSRFEATVRLRHCEKEAVFRPRPKRPRSDGARSSSGLIVPSVIAASSSGSLMPRPSYRIEIRLVGPSQSKRRRTSEAPADIELSTTSARAAAVEYPSPRRASIIAPAFGGACLVRWVIS